MAEIRWNDAQISAIESRDRNILVSAAAGSGKTAVLVERVVRMITDREHPADIGSLLIMTFTRAAASQMREKIYRKIREALKEDPLNEHLRRQLMAVHDARICTIDSLCMDIVRNNFQAVDIDPMFRIADESEITILRSEVLKELIEEKYSDPDEDFLQFVNFYIDKSDSRLEEIILTLHDFAQSHPEPEEWIRQSIAPYIKAAGLGEFLEDDEKNWLDQMRIIIEQELKTIKDEAELGLRLCGMNYGPYKYAEGFEEMIGLIDSITGEDKIFNLRGEAIRDCLDNWQRLPSISAKDDVDEKLKKEAQALRNDIKARLIKLKDTFFSQDLEDSYADMARVSQVAGVIALVTLEFSRKFSEAKKEKNIADFNDVAHHALKVLIRHDENGRMIRSEDGKLLYTAAADSMAGSIAEIIVDEYQDTNMLQERIIQALSAERFGRPDVFMVGDVKQSIYGFRMACPKLFSDKYDAFAEDDGVNSRILLNANYRSRREVIDLVNDIFTQSMIRDIGDIEYTDGHALVCQAEYPEPASEEEFIPEFIYVDESGTDGKITEGYCIARRIEQLISEGHVTDGETGQLRKVRYSDIAILTRTSDNPEIEAELDNRKIPVIKASNKGFFDTFEIRLTIDLLKIIDNPYQDIPFTAVITSPLVGIDSNTLARIKLAYGEEPFSMYRACLSFEGNEDLRLFMESLEDYRSRTAYLGVCELLEYVDEKSGLSHMLRAMKGGDARAADLELLKDKAATYSRGSYSDLYNFLRYIDKLKEADVDFGQAQIFEDEMDAVHMMTIHKSKGLEFPVVFLARTGKDYNRRDIDKNIVLDRELGLGIELRDPVERTLTKTLIMETIREVKKRELYAEELRLLYVALTRAREKLIISGSMNNLKSAVGKWAEELYMASTQLSYSSILQSGSFMKIMGRSLIRHKDAVCLHEVCSLEDVHMPEFMQSSFKESMVSMLDAEAARAEEIASVAGLWEKIDELTNRESLSEEARKAGELINAVYPFEASTRKVIKITASQLEKHTKPRDEDRPAGLFRYNDDETGLRGAARGNAYHRFFELLDYDLFDPDSDEAELTEQARMHIDELKAKGMISEEYAAAIEPEAITGFISSDTGRRMKDAFSAGTLKRETQFVMGYEDEDGEQRLIQGIIDAFFVEDGRAVLVDYKTDRNKTDQEFISTYEGQLNVYADAIEKATGIPVAKKIIYSVEKGRGISF